MTLSHEKTLINKNTPVMLPQGMFLFPLHKNYSDTTSWLEPLSTGDTELVRFPKKFRGSAFIGDNAENHITYDYSHGFMLWELDSSGAGRIGTRTNLGDGTTLITNNDSNTRVYLSLEDRPDTTNVPFTFSFKFKRLEGAVLTSLQIQVYNGSGTALYTTSVLPPSQIGLEDKDGWQIGWYTLPKISGNYRIVIFISSCADFTTTTNSFIIKEPMLDWGDHYTQYVEESVWRGGGLVYDIEHLGMKDAGCVACWIMQSDSMINNKANNDGYGSSDGANNQYLIKLGSQHPYTAVSGGDWHADTTTLWIPITTPRKFNFWTNGVGGITHHLESLGTVSSYGGINTWNHFVIQWDKNRLPSGYTKEFYINGVWQNGIIGATYLPQKPLTYLSLGSWDGNILKPNTSFEQLAFHPSKGFSAEEIKSWYESDAPFVHDTGELTRDNY